jgi:LDH2 family malate/lactate/ureidoglycolate dehydrogenase
MNSPSDVDLSRADTERAVESLLRAAGLPAEHAGLVRRSLMFAETRGTNSHGLARLRPYLERIARGGVNSRPKLTESASGAVHVIDADGSAGAVAGMAAVRAAAQAAGSHGIGIACARNTNHVGALAFYSSALSEAGLVSIVFANADPIMVPPGGSEAVLGSNPIAIGVPGGGGVSQSPLLDMATTAAAHGKIVELSRQGESIPAGWAVDEHGAPTTDAGRALAGALLPAAGPKGFGLAFMIDLLSAGLTGGSLGGGIVPVADRFDEPQGCCLVVIAIDPAHAAGLDSFALADRALVDTVRHSRPVDGQAPMVPGEPEAERARRAAGTETLTVTDALHQDLLDLLRAWSVSAPAVVRRVDHDV